MLTDAEKQKIRSEEIYRQEVQEELQSQKKKKISFWAILNSGFVLFLLSSIVLGGISEYYKYWKNKKDKEESQAIEYAKDELIRKKLSEETLLRLSTIEKLQDTIHEYQSKNVLIAYWGNSIKEDKTLELKYYHLRPLFVEYEKTTLLELLTYLNKYYSGEVSKSIAEVRKLLIAESTELNGGIFVLSKTKKGDILPPGGLLNRKGKLIRQNGFYIYRTIDKRQLKLSGSQLPLRRYYTMQEEQKQLIQSISNLRKTLSGIVEEQ